MGSLLQLIHPTAFSALCFALSAEELQSKKQSERTAVDVYHHPLAVSFQRRLPDPP
jgi:hypothetical protein